MAGLMYCHAKNIQKKEEMEYIPLFVKREDEFSILDETQDKGE